MSMLLERNSSYFCIKRKENGGTKYMRDTLSAYRVTETPIGKTANILFKLYPKYDNWSFADMLTVNETFGQFRAQS